MSTSRTRRPDIAVVPAVGLLGTLTAAGADLDAAARRAAESLGLPLGLVTVLLDDRQVVVGAAGFGAAGLPTLDSAAGWEFCANAARRSGPFISPDTGRDPRRSPHAALRTDGLRSFAAVPLCDDGCPVLGALAVAGVRPRWIGQDAVDRLRGLAALTMLELRRDHGLV